MADNNNGYSPPQKRGPLQPQNDNLQQHAPTTSDAQDQQFAQEPLGAPQEAPAQNDDAQQPQPEAQDTRPTQPLAPVAPTSEQAQASEPTQPLQPQPTQPLSRPACADPARPSRAPSSRSRPSSRIRTRATAATRSSTATRS